MNDGVTISTFQLFQLFPNQESARLYFESRLWPNVRREAAAYRATLR